MSSLDQNDEAHISSSLSSHNEVSQKKKMDLLMVEITKIRELL